MDGVVKLWGKTKNFIQDAVKSTNFPPDERIQSCLSKLEKLETIIRVIKKNFESYASAIRAAAEASCVVSDDLSQFYKAAQQKTRQSTIRQFSAASNTVRSKATSLFQDGFRNTDTGVLAEFSRWLDQIGRLKERGEDAHRLRQQAFTSHQRANTLREKLNKRGGSMFGGVSAEDKRDIERALPQLDEDAQLKKAQYESMRTNIESQSKKIIQSRGRQLDSCWRKLLMAQIEFFRTANEQIAPLEASLNETNSSPRRVQQTQRPTKTKERTQSKPTPPVVKNKKPVPKPKPEPPPKVEAPRAPQPQATVATDGLLDFGSGAAPEPIRTNGTPGLSKSHSSSAENFGDLLNMDKPQPNSSTSPQFAPEHSRSYSDSGQQQANPPQPKPNTMDFLDFGNSPPSSNGKKPPDLLDVFGSPQGANTQSVDDPLDLFGSPSPSSSQSHPPRLAKPKHDQNPIDLMSEPSQSHSAGGGFDILNGAFGGSRTNMMNGSTNTATQSTFDMFSQSSSSPNQQQHHQMSRNPSTNAGGFSLGGDISAGFQSLCGDAATRAVRNDAKAQTRINQAVQEASMAYDISRAEENAHQHAITESRYNLRQKLDGWQKRNGTDRDIRSLLSNLHTVLWDGNRWKKVGLADLTSAAKVKKQYQKAIRVIHPDRHKDDPIDVQVVSERTFEAVNEAWKRFDIKR